MRAFAGSFHNPYIRSCQAAADILSDDRVSRAADLQISLDGLKLDSTGNVELTDRLSTGFVQRQFHPDLSGVILGALIGQGAIPQPDLASVAPAGESLPRRITTLLWNMLPSLKSARAITNRSENEV